MRLLLLAVGALVGYWVGRDHEARMRHEAPNLVQPTVDDIDWLRDWLPVTFQQASQMKARIGGLN